jgi:hypothetical protein
MFYRIKTGPVKQLIYNSIYIFVIVSFLSMQTYVEWERHQFQRNQNFSNVNLEGETTGNICDQNYPNINIAGGIIRKTGNTSALAISLALSHLLLIFFVPEELKQELYYFVKVNADYNQEVISMQENINATSKRK